MVSRTLFHLRNVIAALPLAYALFSDRWEREAAWVGPAAVLVCLSELAVRSWASAHCAYA
ncbi:MAG: hypothetical protein ACREAA_00230 [Candidatus Polarisedimenticolia bacterium]